MCRVFALELPCRPCESGRRSSAPRPDSVSIAKLSPLVGPHHLPYCWLQEATVSPGRPSRGHANLTLPQLRRQMISLPLNPEVVSQLAGTGQCTSRAETPSAMRQTGSLKFQTPFAEPDSSPCQLRQECRSLRFRRGERFHERVEIASAAGPGPCCLHRRTQRACRSDSQVPVIL